jgi:hypothetical protein
MQKVKIFLQYMLGFETCVYPSAREERLMSYCYRSSVMSNCPPFPTCAIIAANKQLSFRMTDLVLSCNTMLLSSGQPFLCSARP